MGRRRGTWRALATAAAIACAAGLLGTTVPAWADDAIAPAPSPDPAYCAEPLARARAIGADAALLARGTVRVYGQQAAAVPLDLASPPFTDPSRVLWYRSLVWLTPLLVDAARAGDVATLTVWVGRALEALARVPDPGSSSASARDAAFATGWDGGTNVHRLRALVCLRSLVTGSPALTAAVEQGVAVNVDEQRYYGPPLQPAHNIGTQANLALLDAARLLGRPDWRGVAVTRLVRDVASAFEPCGLTREQSLPYFVGNVGLWRAVPPVLREDGLVAAAEAVERRIGRAERAIRIVTTPDGTVPVIGDGGEYLRQEPGWTRPAAGLLCRETGWAARHVAGQHYVVRFGPPRALHGHADHGSIVWWDRYPILVDPGSPGYDASPAARWARSNQAHSVVTVAGVPFRSATALRAARWTDRADTYALADAAGGTRRGRNVVVLPRDHALLVVDAVVTDRSRAMVQRWSLAPGWRRATADTWTRASRRLRVTSLDLLTGRAVPVGRTVTDRWTAPLSAPRRADTVEVSTRGGALRLVTVLTTGATPAAVRVEGWWRVGGITAARVRVGGSVVDVGVSAAGVPSVVVHAAATAPAPPAPPPPQVPRR